MSDSLRRALGSLILTIFVVVLAEEAVCESAVCDFFVSIMGGTDPQVAFDPSDQQYLVVWAGSESENGRTRIFGQLIDVPQTRATELTRQPDRTVRLSRHCKPSESCWTVIRTFDVTSSTNTTNVMIPSSAPLPWPKY